MSARTVECDVRAPGGRTDTGGGLKADLGRAGVSRVLHPVVSVDHVLHLDPLDRLQMQIVGDNSAPCLREEPITFDIHDPIFGYGCRIPGCTQHSTQATWWCNRHTQERLEMLRSGAGEAHWIATAVPYPTRPPAVATDCCLPACRFCADRDAVEDGLCRRHAVLYRQARRMAGPRFDEAAWAVRQIGLPGSGNCQIRNCQRGRSQSRACALTTASAGVRPAPRRT
jgi:hypothetical protein